MPALPAWATLITLIFKHTKTAVSYREGFVRWVWVGHRADSKRNLEPGVCSYKSGVNPRSAIKSIRD